MPDPVSHDALCSSIDTITEWILRPACPTGVAEAIASVCQQAENLSQRERSWKLLVEKLREELKWLRVDYGFLRADVSTIAKWVDGKQRTTDSRHPQDVGHEAQELIDLLFKGER